MNKGAFNNASAWANWHIAYRYKLAMQKEDACIAHRRTGRF